MHKNSECMRKAKFLTGVWRAVNVAGYVVFARNLCNNRNISTFIASYSYERY